jgi:hypothetical protein
MTDYEIIVSNRNLSDEWRWQVVRISSVSDTESVIAEGECTTSEEALGKAKAWLADLYARRERGEWKTDDVTGKCFACVRCESHHATEWPA